jgi:DNA-binding MarR family transcriptional regulator
MQQPRMTTGDEAHRIPGYLLWQVSKLWQRRLNFALGDLDLSSTQAIILINVPRLNQEHVAVTQSALAEATRVDRMTVSQSIRALERKGLVTRIVAPGNRRALQVDLTERGGVVASAALHRISAAHGEFFGPMGDDARAYVDMTRRLIQANVAHESELKASGKGENP